MKLSVGFLALSFFALQASALPEGQLAKRQCTNTLNTANPIANRLHSYYDSGSHTFKTSGRWIDANHVETLVNLMLAEGSTSWGDVVLGGSATTAMRMAANSGTSVDSWKSFVQGFWDDSLWIVLAIYKAIDYGNAHGQDVSALKTNADRIYQYVANEWDGTCGGGVWWNNEHGYKNAITNELFLTVSAIGYKRNNNQQYKDNANKTWNWLKNSGMRNGDNLWNDGLDMKTCKNNGQNTWTYNQGVILSGLATLASINNDQSLLTEAEKTLDAAISKLTVNGILKETCDTPNPGGSHCDGDGGAFKGIFMKHVQYYLDWANDGNRNNKYRNFIGTVSAGVINYGRSSAQDIGTVWYSPDKGGSLFNAISTGGGLNALVVNAKYGPC